MVKDFSGIASGVPCEDTYARVLSGIRPPSLLGCLASLVRELADRLSGTVVAIDGKTARRSHDRSSGLAPLHLLSAWASSHGIVLGRVATEEKSKVITAIPELLDLLDVAGAIVTIDAMGNQTKIVEKIVEKKADYVLQLKANQPCFYQEANQFFEWAIAEKFKDIPHSRHESVDGEHGRIEARRVILTSDIKRFSARSRWKGPRSLTMLQRIRELPTKMEIETSY